MPSFLFQQAWHWKGIDESMISFVIRKKRPYHSEGPLDTLCILCPEITQFQEGGQHCYVLIVFSLNQIVLQDPLKRGDDISYLKVVQVIFHQHPENMIEVVEEILHLLVKCIWIIWILEYAHSGRGKWSVPEWLHAGQVFSGGAFELYFQASFCSLKVILSYVTVSF